ncbi:MAG: serine/threonine protein kinase, partial [Gemmataceae bacterium]|nr:serine/threonine protein kinase [Gemmataceae bacterium]
MPPEELARLLVEVGAVRPDQVGEAARAADVEGFLAAVTGPPPWDPAGPPLTAWQAERVRRAASPAALARGLRVGDYLYLDLIGQGGMGRVYRGWDLARNQPVALKRVKNPTDVTRRRLVREFKAMRRLGGNPAVVGAVELIRRAAGDVDILVMEYLNGGDLVGQVRAAGGRLPWRRVVKWADMLLQGLAAAHARKLVHRDIKPANVLIHRTADRDIARLADWGVVKDIGGVTTVGTQAGNVVGTWRYMPPEQWVTGAG